MLRVGAHNEIIKMSNNRTKKKRKKVTRRDLTFEVVVINSRKKMNERKVKYNF